jgi:ferritin-like metal-binding protein YciE
MTGVPVARDTKDAVNSYITDMLALEEHIEKAIKGQFTDLKDYPDVQSDLRQFHRTVEHHISDLKGLRDRRHAGGMAEAIKRAGSAVAGAGAAAIDLMRTEGLPKDLRDDYTAFNLATIGYLMLYTTALSLGDGEVSELARQHYTDYAAAVSRLHNLTPAAVLRYLQQEGLPAVQTVLPEINRVSIDAWRRIPEEQPSSTSAGTATGATRQL